MQEQLLILNGSPAGSSENCAELARWIEMQLSPHTSVQIAALAEYKNFTSLLAAISRLDGFVFVSGTYWDSWGSPLQRFLEEPRWRALPHGWASLLQWLC